MRTEVEIFIKLTFCLASWSFLRFICPSPREGIPTIV